uniref:Uncharacterized protein n=1 Tax=Hucho hucho TaxID=62062 RepID=A0A4W5KEF9_9TELE
MHNTTFKTMKDNIEQKKQHVPMYFHHARLTSGLAGILGNPGLAEKFLLLYGTSQNIDVWVGAISEPPLPGGRVGPLLACLLAKQFRALRDGDRFWWEREAVFTSTQRAQLHTVSLSRIICDNTHITRVPSDPFSLTVSPEDMLACSHPLIPHLNLSAWKEPDTGTVLLTLIPHLNLSVWMEPDTGTVLLTLIPHLNLSVWIEPDTGTVLLTLIPHLNLSVWIEPDTGTVLLTLIPHLNLFVWIEPDTGRERGRERIEIGHGVSKEI